jgi:hypothetical protein
MSSNNWSCEVSGDVPIFEFEEGMDQSEFAGSAWDEYTTQIDRHDVSGLVTVVRMDDPFHADTFEVWNRSGQKAVKEGITKWGVVAEGLKSMSLKSQLDVPGLDVYTTEDRNDGIEWVRS